MKPISLKNLCTTASLLVGLVGMSSAQADQHIETLVGAGASDMYSLTCPIGTTSVQANVNDQGGADGIFVSVQVIAPLGRASDNPIAADGGGASGTAILAGGGAGGYLVVVNKQAAGAAGFEGYQLFTDCFQGGAAFPPVTSAIVQDQ